MANAARIPLIARNGAVALLSIASAWSQARAEELVFRLMDQHGVPIPGSRARIDGGLFCEQGAVIDLVPGAHTIELLPGLSGNAQEFLLYRSEIVTVSAGQTELTAEWITATVQVDVRDQHGTSIHGSQVELSGIAGGLLPTPMQIVLPISDPQVYPSLHGAFSENEGDGYDLWIVPGLNGGQQAYLLYRGAGRGGASGSGGPRVEVHASTSALAFEWITTALEIDVRDQHGTSIPGSQVALSGIAGGLRPTPAQIVLPISDPQVYPSLHGAFSESEGDGYDLWIVPGLNGAQQDFALYRGAGRGGPSGTGGPGVEVHASTQSLHFEWITADLLIDVRDQHGISIPGSQVEFAGIAGGTRLASTQLVLPITDPLQYPSLHGAFSEHEGRGYDLWILPGLGGHTQPFYLYRSAGRSSPPQPSVEVHVGQTELAFEWRCVDCAVQVHSGNGAPVLASVFELPAPYSSFSPGQLIRFPVTENAIYPSLAGTYANGYPIRVAPGDVAPASALYEFEALSNETFAPETFLVDGLPYRLGCQANRPPFVSAGDHRTIASSDQSATVISGTAVDPDGDPMTYVWKRAGLALGAPRTVDPLGSAPLALSDIAPLGTGDHELSLEVSDGSYAVSARMVLVIENSPPTVACAGGGTYQLGIDMVALRGTLADFDGDLLDYEWRLGAVVLGAGSIASIPGGGPILLPPVTLTTGLGASDLGAGAHRIVLACSDRIHLAVECEVNLQIVDTVAPTLAPVSDTLLLWPPNHRMVNVLIRANARDASGGPVVLSASITSSEDSGKSAHGATVPDFSVLGIDHSTGEIYLQLRAERSGSGPGRTYAVSITATDLGLNQSTAVVSILAPHDRR